MLRNCFIQREDDGQIFQVVLRSLPSSPLNAHEHPADIVSQMNGRPPIRLQLSGDDGDETIVSLSIHHALFDGTSLPVLLKDVEREYLYGPQIDFPSSASILEKLHTIDLSQAQQFWTKTFSDFDWLGSRLGPPSTTSAAVTSAPFHTPLSALKAKASACQVTLQTVLTCAYGYLLATRLYGRNDIAFGVCITNTVQELSLS